MKTARICVYAGSSFGASARYSQAAAAFGKACAQRGLGIVYGGGNVGLMGVLANAALAVRLVARLGQLGGKAGKVTWEDAKVMGNDAQLLGKDGKVTCKLVQELCKPSQVVCRVGEVLERLVSRLFINDQVLC